jgi:hypothetical protein
MSVLTRIRAAALVLVDQVRAARAAPPPAPADDSPPPMAIRTPGTHEAIELPKARVWDRPPTQAELHFEARRLALAYARQRTGNPELTWKHAKLLIDRWAKEERRAERAQPPEK